MHYRFGYEEMFINKYDTKKIKIVQPDNFIFAKSEFCI